jgi:glycosyltransferase involved in cell wall biosynthesis
MRLKSEQRVFVLYPYYWPNFKAGGPTQSLFNLAAILKDEIDFFIVSYDKDIDGSGGGDILAKNNWSIGPNGEKIFYTEKITLGLIARLTSEIKPHLLYINGIFNFQTTLFGLICARIFKFNVVISPRGMLQRWALNKKSGRKKWYIFLIKFLIKGKDNWHATDVKERDDITRIFKPSGSIFIAPNVPRYPTKYTEVSLANSVPIRLIFLSLINKNKNLHLVIDAVNNNPAFTLDIFGPASDKSYWMLCEGLIKSDRISYKGSIPPWTVPEVLQGYHFFVLPTEGENFGHAIFDALASCVPVLITKHTPWKEIEEKQCGFYIDLSKNIALAELLKEIENMGNQSYLAYRKNSLSYAENYWQENDYVKHYNFLIG